MPKSHTKWHSDDLHATPQSIAEAKRAQLLERLDFERQTGLLLRDDGSIALSIANSIAAACYGPRGEKR
jgi:hypothetical protein